MRTSLQQTLGVYPVAVLTLLAACAPASSRANFVVINEIFNDPGGAGTDERDEYIELRGTPGMSLANLYLIFVENEVSLSGQGNAGIVENIFTLGDNPNTPGIETPYALGSNGFLTMRQKDTLYANPPAGTTDLVQTGSGSGWGSDSSSTIRHSGEAGKTRIENSGFTAMLIRNIGDPVFGQPFLGLDLDVGNNGLDAAPGQFGWRNNWTILDSIGIHGEADEANGRLYGKVNFGQEPTGNIEPDAVYLGGGYEIEMISRWGDSTGHTLADWHATNLSDRTVAGFFSASATTSPGPPPVIDYRQSGGYHDTPLGSFVETSQYVPYGTPLTTTLGAPNYPLNLEHLPWDYNQDGAINAADYTVWRDSLGQTGLALAADGDGGGSVNAQDYDWWRARYGYSWSDVPGYVAPGTAASVPEPCSLVTIVLGVGACSALRRLRADSRRPFPND
ncbi:MAG: hypothetical protein ACRCT8_06250 [Lacipirellulaceae bacterium]